MILNLLFLILRLRVLPYLADWQERTPTQGENVTTTPEPPPEPLNQTVADIPEAVGEYDIVTPLVGIFKAIVTLGDSSALLLQAVVGTLGFVIPLMLFRILIMIGVFWAFLHWMSRMTWWLAVVLGIVGMGVAFGLVGFSFFGESLGEALGSLGGIFGGGS